MVTEARLAEIEAAWPFVSSPPNLPVTMKAVAVIHELIAAVKQAWRERDEAEKREGSYFGRITASDLRAARAEAEVERLKHPTVTVSWKDGQQTLPLDKVVFHIERLQAVKEAAEALLDILSDSSVNVWPAGANDLRRALDACAKDHAEKP